MGDSATSRSTAPDPALASGGDPRLDQGPSLVGRLLDAEPGALVLGLPVVLGMGIIAYFALPVEPPPWLLPLILLGVGLGVGVGGRGGGRVWPRHETLGVVGWALGVAVLGATVAQAWALAAARPVLVEPVGPLRVEGRVAQVEPLARGWRIVLDDVRWGGAVRGEAPRRIRLRVQAALDRSDAPVPGLWVATRARMAPPPRPVLPGGFDMGRELWFAGIGAVGFTLTPLRVRPDPGGGDGIGRLGAAIQALRTHVTARFLAAGGPQTGPLAAAMLTGDARAIPESVIQAYRVAGLSHILAISGLNMSLTGGLVYVLARALFALWPAVALRFPVKKLAAAVAVLCCLFYLALSGAGIPAQRAFLMFSLVLLAVVLDRTALSRRTLALSATVVLLLAPWTVLGASFQLSYAAVLALIALFEEVAPRLNAWRAEGGGWRTGVVYGAGVVLSSVAATLVTTPISAHHFHQVSLYGVAANVIGVPVTSFWVMPWGLVALVLMPFGLETPAVAVMGWGLDVTVAVARQVEAWPGAVLAVPKGPAWALGAVGAGIVWLCLWRGAWRWLGLLLIVVGGGVPFLTAAPDVLVGPSVIAVRQDDGTFWVSDVRKGRFERLVWAEAFRAPFVPVSTGGRCGEKGCWFRVRGVDVVVRKEEARVLLLRQGKVVADLSCLEAREKGVHAVWVSKDGAGSPVTVRSVEEGRGKRPWAAFGRGAAPPKPTPPGAEAPGPS